MKYFDEVQAALTSEEGYTIMAQLLSLLETRDVPFIGITISVKVPPEPQRRVIGRAWGNVDLEVTS